MVIKKGKYRHYKGNEYEVIDMAINSETLEEMVLYKPLYGEQLLWVRPAYMWDEKIIIEGKEMSRFEFVQD